MTETLQSLHNFRKFHKRINKSDKVEPLEVEYYTYVPTEFDNVLKRESFPTKALLYDFIEKKVRYEGFNWDDFEMFKQINQKLIS